MSAVLKERDWREIFAARVRAIQDSHASAHAALLNWGHWSADKRGIFPTLKPPSVWNQFKRSELDEYGEEQSPAVSIIKHKAKPEPRDSSPYDERTAVALDERIHGYGGLAEFVRLALKIAYVTREVPEDQFPAACGCTEDAFCERLLSGLRFAGRFGETR